MGCAFKDIKQSAKITGMIKKQNQAVIKKRRKIKDLFYEFTYRYLHCESSLIWSVIPVF